jgi:hypothetical protein
VCAVAVQTDACVHESAALHIEQETVDCSSAPHLPIIDQRNTINYGRHEMFELWRDTVDYYNPQVHIRGACF